MKTSCPKYSFIVPVYQAEKYLQACVDSILRQTEENFEIILVDDGSPDRSGELCDTLAKHDDRIIAIHKPNGGASSARNCGLKIAKGNYVVFLDSDDYWDDPLGLEKIDVLIDPLTDVIIYHMSPIDCLEYMVTHDLLNMHSSKRMYRKDFLTEHELFFVEGIRTEDVELGLRVANCLPHYKFLNEKLYVYRHHEGSVTQTIAQKHLEEYRWIIETYADYSYQNERVRSLLLSYVAYQYSLLLAYLDYVAPSNKKTMLHALKSYTYLYRYQDYPRTKKIAMIYHLVGYYPLVRALGIYLMKNSNRRRKPCRH